MKVPVLLLSLSAFSLALVPQTGSKAMFAAHDKALKDAKGVEIVFTVQQLPGAAVEHKLALGRPGMFRMETPAKIVTTDSKTLWQYSKGDNTYTEAPTTADEVNALLSQDLTWAWSAFSVQDQFKKVKTADAGVKRMIRGNQVVDITITMEGGKTAHLYFDPKLGMARGASVKSETSEQLILATDIKLGEVASSNFTFTPPTGAKKAEKPKVEEVPYSAVGAVFQRSCIGCHGTGRAFGGLSLNSYGGAMVGGRRGKAVVPGDPDSSSLYQYVVGKRNPRMPKDAPPLGQKDIDTIRNWIASGAKE